MNSRGQFTQETLGNGVVANRSFSRGHWMGGKYQAGLLILVDPALGNRVQGNRVDEVTRFSRPSR